MYPVWMLADFYKVGHIDQYPAGTQQVWSNWTPRKSLIPGIDKVCHVGLQPFMAEYLIRRFNEDFFDKPWKLLENDMKAYMKETLGIDARVDHWKELHKLQYLPIKIYALPEGTFGKIGVPAAVITNTLPSFFWLPNFLESIWSSQIWQMTTSATIARKFRDTFLKYAKQYGEADTSFVNWQGHDFSFRGMSSLESAVLSGMGHLTQFCGTDTMPAIRGVEWFYGCEGIIGGSVPATEHSVMCAGGKDGEFETFHRLITQTYPKGVISIVSDTWDLWKVCTEFIPRLRDELLARDGKVVIRPDSGDPEQILCGRLPLPSGYILQNDVTGEWMKEWFNPEEKGVLRLLAEAMGVTNGMINKVGAIYGDSITLARQEAILNRVVNELKLSPYNVVLGIGSFTYQYNTRDTFGFAMKATAVRHNGKIVEIFKDPVTDSGLKKSAKGIAVSRNGELEQGCTEFDLDDCDYVKVFEDSEILKTYTFNEVRARAQA